MENCDFKCSIANTEVDICGISINSVPTIESCHVENVNISCSNFSKASIYGISYSGKSFTGCTVKNSKIICKTEVTFSYSLFDKATEYRVYRNILEVFIANDLDLYCMKLVSFRPKDVQDMEILAESLKKSGITKVDVTANFIRLYGDEYLLRNDDRKIRFMEMQLTKI